MSRVFLGYQHPGEPESHHLWGHWYILACFLLVPTSHISLSPGQDSNLFLAWGSSFPLTSFLSSGSLGYNWFYSDELPPASLAIAYRLWSCWVICPCGNPESDYWRDSLVVLEMCGIIQSDLPFTLVFSPISGTMGQTSQFEGAACLGLHVSGVWLHCLAHFLLQSMMRNLSSKLGFRAFTFSFGGVCLSVCLFVCLF